MFLTIENPVGEGFKVLGLGMGIVISVLLILMIALYVLIPIFRKISGGTKKADAPVPEAAPAPMAAASAEEDESDVVAAIIAAISAHTGASPSSLKVVSFKRLK